MPSFGVESRINKQWELIEQSIRKSKEEAEIFAKELDLILTPESRRKTDTMHKFRVVKLRNRDLKEKIA